MSRTERTTVNMADGFTRVSNGRRTGVVVTQSGPGIENAYGGVAHAFAESIPILVVPGGPSRDRTQQLPNFPAIEAYDKVLKWGAQANQAARIPEMMRRAYTSLRSGRPGPVMVEVPADVGEEEISEEAFDYQAGGAYSERRRPGGRSGGGAGFA